MQMTMEEKELRRYSRVVVDGDEQASSRAMLRAVGFSDDDFRRPQIGIASTWAMTTPCNMHINDLAKLLDKLRNEYIIITHTTQRTPVSQIRRQLKETRRT